MKTSTNMLSKSFLMIFILGMLTLTINAGEIIIDNTGKNEIKINESSYQALSLSLSLVTINTVEIETTLQPFTRLVIPGYGRNHQFGYPEIPVLRKLIEVPHGAKPRIEIISSDFTEIELDACGITNKVYPCQPPRSKSEDEHEFVFNAEAYQSDFYLENKLVSVDVLGYLRGCRIGRINVFPVQYNPASNKLKIYHNINFRVHFENANIPQTIATKKRLASPYFERINRQLINYQPLSTRDNFMRYPVKYVIISDRMFESQLQPLIEWKELKGFTVIESYTDEPAVGNSTSSIKTYIQSLYNMGTPEDPAPSFVLFVGDVQQIPAWEDGNGETDRLYCEFTGDLFPDIYYGRYSAQTTDQLQPQIDKTIQYEKYTMPDPSYLNEVVMVAGMDGSHGYNWANGQINYGTINYFNEDHGITSHTYLYPESGGMSSQIIQNISDGVTYGNYTAHCSPNGWADPSFTIGDIATLENEDMYGLLVGNCCSSSEYALNECFGEALLRAEDKGSVGYIGASNSTYWDEDYYWAVGVGEISQQPPPYEETTLGMYDRTFHDHGEPFEDWYVSQDEMVFAGNLAVTESGSSLENYYWDVYNILGDPSLMIYMSEPPVMAVSYQPLLPLGSGSLTVTTEPYAYVALSMDGDLVCAVLADDSGIAELEFEPFTTPGMADIVVTKQNGQPFFGTLPISSPNGAYLILDEYDINDSLGNNNGFADYGESVTLDVAIENFGNGEATNANMTISIQDTMVNLTDSTHSWGTIPGQAISWQEDAFAFSVHQWVPDQHIASFDVTIEADDKQTWEYTMDIILNAPIINIVSLTIDDSEFGNNNGRMDPGETVDIRVKNKNDGHCPTDNAIATIESYNAYLTFENTVDTIGSLGLLGSKDAIFRVHVDPETPNGVIIVDLDYDICAGIFEEQKLFKRKIGLLYDDFETGDFTKFDWMMSGDVAWDITNVFPYEGIFSAVSGPAGDGESSEIRLTLEIMTADSISFIKKVSSANGDKLKFYINNTLKAEWSGTSQGWKKQVFYVPTGTHTFKWVYKKDGQVTAGSDKAWLDFVVMPPVMTLTCYAGRDETVCEGDVYQCSGEATDYVAVEWSTSGTGTFDDPTILDPVYSPSGDDYLAGFVELSMIAINSENDTVDDEMNLSFITEPATPAKPDGPDYIDLLSTQVSEYTTTAVSLADTYEWYIDPQDAGIIAGNTSTGTVTWNTEYLGVATISVKAINQCGESDYSEGIEVTVDNTVSISEFDNHSEISIVPNPSRGHIRIFSEALTGKVEIRISDLLGQLVYQANVSGDNPVELDLGNLQEGIYLFTIESDSQRLTDKIIINK